MHASCVPVVSVMCMCTQGTRPRDVAEWLSGAAASKRLNVVSVHLVSAHTGEGGQKKRLDMDDTVWALLGSRCAGRKPPAPRACSPPCRFTGPRYSVYCLLHKALLCPPLLCSLC